MRCTHSTAFLALAAGSTVKIELTVAPDTNTLCVDRAQILQVFQNLIINAIQAMATGQGHIWITAGNVTLADGEVAPLPAGSYVSVEVKDNGCGMDRETLSHLFEPFFTNKPRGTGLGLAVSQAIARAHGGEIVAEPPGPGGTCFVIRLPRPKGDTT